eukprot:XP_019930647.1 PREDICTED: platelet endothelial aggregation receptor 1-like [Crassostrea gigas]
MQGWLRIKCEIFTYFIIWTSVIQKVDNDSNDDCGYGAVKDGDNCKECSVGYSGDNCSVVCPSDSYGKLCSQTCDSHCISCHHILGCNVTEETTETRQSTSKHMASETPVPLAVYNITDQGSTSKSRLFKF